MKITATTHPDMPSHLRAIASRLPEEESEEAAFVKMATSAGIMRGIPVPFDNGSRGYACEGFAWSYLLVFDPNGNCLGMVGEPD